VLPIHAEAVPELPGAGASAGQDREDGADGQGAAARGEGRPPLLNRFPLLTGADAATADPRLDETCRGGRCAGFGSVVHRCGGRNRADPSTRPAPAAAGPVNGRGENHCRPEPVTVVRAWSRPTDVRTRCASLLARASLHDRWFGASAAISGRSCTQPAITRCPSSADRPRQRSRRARRPGGRRGPARRRTAPSTPARAARPRARAHPSAPSR
jgi:hypothetical protein